MLDLDRSLDWGSSCRMHEQDNLDTSLPRVVGQENINTDTPVVSLPPICLWTLLLTFNLTSPRILGQTSATATSVDFSRLWPDTRPDFGCNYGCRLGPSSTSRPYTHFALSSRSTFLAPAHVARGCEQLYKCRSSRVSYLLVTPCQHI